jgi:hypothetical protein
VVLSPSCRADCNVTVVVAGRLETPKTTNKTEIFSLL